METHKINGIELLMPLVPKGATTLHLMGWHLHYMIGLNHKFIQMPVKQNLTILGHCWYEDDELVCEGFDPEKIVSKYERKFFLGGELKIAYKDKMLSKLDSWLRSEGITIPEGMKLVLIKVN